MARRGGLDSLRESGRRCAAFLERAADRLESSPDRSAVDTQDERRKKTCEVVTGLVARGVVVDPGESLGPQSF